MTTRDPKRSLPHLVSCLLLLLSAPLAGAAPAAALEVVEVAEGVFAVLQPTGNRFNQSNSAFIVGDDGLVVIDTQSTLAATREVIAEIRARTELPVRYLVLTHWHGDHVQGISAYRERWPAVVVIGHATLEADIRDRAQPQLEQDIELYHGAIADAEDRLERRVSREGEALDDEGVATLAGQIDDARRVAGELGSIPRPLALPGLAYAREITLGSGPGAIRLLHRVAHTRGDTLVYLPASKVLVTGDVLDDLPFGGHGYPSRWVEVFDELEALDIEVIVPGHGSVRRGKEHLRLVAGLFRELVGGVAAAVEEGLGLEETQTELAARLESYRTRLVGDDPGGGRAWDGFIPATVERAWLEARDELPD